MYGECRCWKYENNFKRSFLAHTNQAWEYTPQQAKKSLAGSNFTVAKSLNFVGTAPPFLSPESFLFKFQFSWELPGIGHVIDEN